MSFSPKPACRPLSAGSVLSSPDRLGRLNDIAGIGFMLPMLHQDISVQFHEIAEQRNVTGVHPAAHETQARCDRHGRHFRDRDACHRSGRNLHSDTVARGHTRGHPDYERQTGSLRRKVRKQYRASSRSKGELRRGLRRFGAQPPSKTSRRTLIPSLFYSLIPINANDDQDQTNLRVIGLRFEPLGLGQTVSGNERQQLRFRIVCKFAIDVTNVAVGLKTYL